MGSAEDAGVGVVDRALAHVAGRAALKGGPPVPAGLRVTMHFHPDRLVEGVPLLARLAAEGAYRSQFETGTSNGGLTAHPDGDRWQWEHRLFAGAYDDADPAHRPKYGSLNHRRRAAGGSVRFGSAHLRLNVATLARTTFCYPDSVYEPTAVGTAYCCDLIALADADDRAARVDVLDDYIEAQVHGPLLLARDVEAVVLDPVFRGTDVELAAARLPVPVEWHHGFQLTAEELGRHPDYRGADVVITGCEIARDGVLDAHVVGAAVAAGQHDPQTLKRVWHTIARFGHPLPSDTRPRN